MFSDALAGARAAGLALLTAALLAACGSDDSPPTPAATPAASRLVVDTGSAAPVAGGTLTLKATLLAADGSELKGASFAWTSSEPTVAFVVSASDKAPAAVPASMMAAAAAPVGTYATVHTLAAGAADITATATLADGSRITSVTHLVVQAAPAKSYTLVLSPATVGVTAGGAAKTVTVSVRRSDGVDGVADLTNWSWTSDDVSFVATPAADGRSAQVASPNSATAASAATLTACADAPAVGRLCANAALTRNTSLPLTYTVGGTVSGLAMGKSLQLADTNGDTQVISANGGFTLPTPRQAASAYAVTVAAQPAGQTCTVTNGTGVVSAANVASIAITCVQAQFVVVANRDDRTISSYRIDPSSGAPIAVPGSPFAFNGKVNAVAFEQSGLFGYAVTEDTLTVIAFTLDPTTGALALIPGGTTLLMAPGAPQSIVVNPSGQWLHIGLAGGLLGIENHQIDGITHKSIPVFASGSAAGGGTELAISADGARLYVSDTLQNGIGKVDFGAGFGFDWFSRVNVPAGGPSSSATVLSPDGSRFYVPDRVANMVGVSAVDSSTGQLSAMTVFPAGVIGAADIALTPSGQVAYVLGNAGFIARHLLDPATGTSTAVDVVPVGINGRRLRIESKGRFLYTPSLNGSLHVFSISGSTGALTELIGSPFATGNGNVAIAIVEPRP